MSLLCSRTDRLPLDSSYRTLIAFSFYKPFGLESRVCLSKACRTGHSNEDNDVSYLRTALETVKEKA